MAPEYEIITLEKLNDEYTQLLTVLTDLNKRMLTNMITSVAAMAFQEELIDLTNKIHAKLLEIEAFKRENKIFCQHIFQRGEFMGRQCIKITAARGPYCINHHQKHSQK